MAVTSREVHGKEGSSVAVDIDGDERENIRRLGNVGGMAHGDFVFNFVQAKVFVVSAKAKKNL